jgi:uncharacterized membrane protein
MMNGYPMMEGYSESEREEERSRKNVNVGRIDRRLSIIGGAALGIGGIMSMINRRFFPGAAMLTLGSMFLYRGSTGYCNIYKALGLSTAGTSDTGVTLEHTLTINRSPQEVYEFWHDFSNLPRFMDHLESVQVSGPKTSHWKAKSPAGVPVEWDAEMTEDTPHRISWTALGSADVPNEGTVEFREAAGGRGTEVKVSMQYYPPAGTVGKAAAKVLNKITRRQMEEDLKKFKQVLETGETATAGMTGRRAAGF